MTFPRAVCLAVLLLAAVWLTACQTSQVVMNGPLAKDASGAPVYAPGYALLDMLEAPRGEILLTMAFSGGGKRSAAFAYGALLGLHEMTVVENGRPRPLLDDVDSIAAVSGGSFPAMHYGLYRDASFKTFDRDFLKQDINARIWALFLLPWNWEWLFNPLFGTNDAMAAIYDRLMFHGATYADLARQGLPMISVNATDLAGGTLFAFNQQTFDLLCSDLSSFPVSRAVAASAGFPGLFTPITLTSHRDGCRGSRPPAAPPREWLDNAGQLSRNSAIAANAERLLDPDRTSFVHLMDGGISDNLALRSLSNALIRLDADEPELRRLALGTRRVIVISVDGQGATDPTLGQHRVVSGFRQIFSAVSRTQLDAYSFETLLLADQQVRSLADKIRRFRCEVGRRVGGHDCNDVQGELVQISLGGIADPAERQRLQALPTSLTLPDADVDALVAAGKKMVQTNPALLRLIADFNGRVVVAADTGRVLAR